MNIFIDIFFYALLSAQALTGTSTTPNDLSQLNPVQIIEVEIKNSAQTKSQNQLLPGDTVELKIKLNIDNGFHAYLEQYRLQLIGPQEFYISEFQIKPTVEFTDPLTKKIKIGTEKYAEMITLLDIPSQIRTGTHRLELELTYQACGADFCLFPKKIPIVKDIHVGQVNSDKLTEALSKGWVYALVIVFIAGILTSFTPCIFPMIPITLAILGTADHGRTRAKGFFISLTYVLGIALTYATLGVIAAKTGALFGSLLGHPIVVSLISFLFILMGLSMYGLFEIKLPDRWANKFTKNKTQKGFIGAFISGLIAGVVASPCVGPVLVSILAYVAQTQNTFSGFVLLFTYALGLGQLFLIIGTFNSVIQKIPKSGPWLEQIKFVFGTMMIAMALYFVYPVTHSNLFDGLVATALIVISLYFGAFKNKNKIHSQQNKMKKAFFIVTFCFGLLFAIKSFIPKHIQNNLFIVSSQAEKEKSYPKPNWFKYSDELLAQALREKRPVIIDFKADWCLACKELELYTFSDARVLELGQKFLWLEFDATSPSDELSSLQKKYGIGGLPYVAIYNTKGEQDKSLTVTGFIDAEDFLQRLKTAIQ